MLFPHLDSRDGSDIDHVFPKGRFTPTRLKGAQVDEELVDQFRDRSDRLAPGSHRTLDTGRTSRALRGCVTCNFAFKTQDKVAAFIPARGGDSLTLTFSRRERGLVTHPLSWALYIQAA